MLSDKYKHSLVFKINKNESVNILNKWKEIKEKCESGSNENIVNEWLKRCDKNSIKNLPYLDRMEGGIGGNNNKTDRQIRFRHYSENDNNIVLNIINDPNTTEHWSNNDLEDLAYGFIKYINEYVGKECVNGGIKKKKKY